MDIEALKRPTNSRISRDTPVYSSQAGHYVKLADTVAKKGSGPAGYSTYGSAGMYPIQYVDINGYYTDQTSESTCAITPRQSQDVWQDLPE